MRHSDGFAEVTALAVHLASALLLAGGLAARLQRRFVLSVVLALFGVATAHGPDLLAVIASH